MAKKNNGKSDGRPPQLKVMVRSWHWESKRKKVDAFELVNEDEKVLDFVRAKLKEHRCMRIEVIPYEKISSCGKRQSPVEKKNPSERGNWFG